MSGDDVIVIDDDGVLDDDVIIIIDDDPTPHDPDLDPLVHTFGGRLSENQRLLYGFVAYLLTAVVPGLGLATASSVVGGWMVALPSGQAPSPWVVTVAPWLPAITAAALLIGTLTGVVLVAWSARTTASRVAGICLLITVHSSVVLLGGSLATFGGVVAAQQPKPHITVRHPSTAGRRATVSRLRGDDCGWVLTESQGAKPMAVEVDKVLCSCSGMPDASARWVAAGPILVDAGNGMPYVCAPPPRQCSTSPAGGSPLAALALLLLRRRRGRETARLRREERA